MDALFLTRNKEHELAMISIFDALTYSSMDLEFSLEEITSAVYEMPFEDVPLFSKTLIIKALAHINEIKVIFQSKMPKWNFDRLNLVEQAILLMSYSHSKYENGDKKIVIDVAVRLAKKYLDKDDYKFVNAILDNVL